MGGRRDKLKPMPDMAPDDLRAFVLNYLAGAVFTSEDVHPSQVNLIPMIFMPLALGGRSVFGDIDPATIGAIWEYASEAGYRGINGYPMFPSCRMMSKDDWRRAATTINAERERLRALEIAPLESTTTDAPVSATPDRARKSAKRRRR